MDDYPLKSARLLCFPLLQTRWSKVIPKLIMISGLVLVIAGLEIRDWIRDTKIWDWWLGIGDYFTKKSGLELGIGIE